MADVNDFNFDVQVKGYRIVRDTGNFIDENGRVQRHVSYEKIPTIFGQDGQLILAPKYPDIPEELRKRCPKDQLEKWDNDRKVFNEAFTKILRNIA